jgi:signal transduction histidine kinase
MMGSVTTPTLEDAFQTSMTQALLIATGAAALAAVVVSLFIAERIARPVRRIAAASRRIAAGHYAERVSGDSFDQAEELGQLANNFNDMAAALESTERRRVELLADVAHELSTPISTLDGYLEGLLDGIVQPTPETWARLRGETGRLRMLVSDLRELSRAENRQFSLKLEPVAASDIVQAALDRLRMDFDEEGLELVTQLTANLPKVTADRDRAVQVLTNLLTNALRYTPPPGKVTISVHRVASGISYQGGSGTIPGSPHASSDGLRDDAGAGDAGDTDSIGISGATSGNDVLFQVADTGIGIPAEHLPHLFERFYRVDKSRSRAAGGAGIGLTIAKAVVEAMGGRIWAESEGPGCGSTFSFTLPAARRA